MSQEQLELIPTRRRIINAMDAHARFMMQPTAMALKLFDEHISIIKSGVNFAALPSDMAPVHSGFYLTCWQAYTGNYYELGWFDVSTQKWWSQHGQEMLTEKFTFWVGVNEQIGRTRRTLL